jgi:hypothetical protein
MSKVKNVFYCPGAPIDQHKFRAHHKYMNDTALTSIEATAILILVIWSFVWKGIALWYAGGKKDKIWFIVLLLLNTVGILDMLYIFIFSKRKSTKSTD